MTDPASTPVPEHVAVWRRIRAVFGGPAARVGRDARRRARAADDETTVPYGRGREPRGIADVLDVLSSDMGWESPLARSDLLAAWNEIVGQDTARHAAPVGIEAGVLTVRCDSTAWAHQLRSLRSGIVSTILERHPRAGVESIRFLGPDTPSWKRGPRAVPGRGPRDTYG